VGERPARRRPAITRRRSPRQRLLPGKLRCEGDRLVVAVLRLSSLNASGLKVDGRSSTRCCLSWPTEADVRGLLGAANIPRMAIAASMLTASSLGLIATSGGNSSYSWPARRFSWRSAPPSGSRGKAPIRASAVTPPRFSTREASTTATTSRRSFSMSSARTARDGWLRCAPAVRLSAARTG